MLWKIFLKVKNTHSKKTSPKPCAEKPPRVSPQGRCLVSSLSERRRQRETRRSCSKVPFFWTGSLREVCVTRTDRCFFVLEGRMNGHPPMSCEVSFFIWKLIPKYKWWHKLLESNSFFMVHGFGGTFWSPQQNVWKGWNRLGSPNRGCSPNLFNAVFI